MKVFDGSSTVGSVSSFQVPSLSGPVTSQEQGSPVSPQVFSSIPAPRASGLDEFQQALKDPEFAKAVRGLELCRKVRERERLRDSGMVDSCRVSNADRRGRVPLLHSNSAVPEDVASSVGERGDQESRADVGEGVRSSTAGECAGIVRSREFESARATAGERSGGIGLLEVTESDFPSLSYSVNSCLGLSTSACARASRVARAVAAARVCPVSSSSAVSAVAHAHATTLHGAHNSWSDTVRVKGPTGTRRVKGGVSCTAEDLRPVAEVAAGVNFRPAGGVREQVAGSLPRRQPGTGTRQVRGGAVTPSLHLEVPGIQFVSPGYGLDIRQSMGWTKVCRNARSGIWVLMGNARTCMFPANPDHLRVEWMKRGAHKTAWVTPGHDCQCSYAYGHGAAVRPQTNDAIWHGVIGL